MKHVGEDCTYLTMCFVCSIIIHKLNFHVEESVVPKKRLWNYYNIHSKLVTMYV
jgi:hypothetical protein